MFLSSAEADEVFGIGMLRSRHGTMGFGYRDLHRLPDAEVYVVNGAMADFDAVLEEGVADVEVVEYALLELALEHEGAGGAVLHGEVQGLVDLLHVEALGCRCVVGKDDAVAAEIVVVGVVAEVAAVGPVLTF